MDNLAKEGNFCFKFLKEKYVSLCGYVLYESRDPRSPAGGTGFPELRLQVVVSCLIGCWVISPTLKRVSSDGDNIYHFNTTFSKDVVFLSHLLIFFIDFFGL